MTHWGTEYIGKPWVVASDGPDAYDCWGLVVEIHRRLYGRTLEIIPVEENNLKALIRTIDAHPERKRWETVRRPKEGDIALMRQSRHPIHVGVWLDVDGGGILHCIQGAGVVFQNLLSLSSTGWKIDNYYRYIGDQAHGTDRHPS